MRTIELAWPTEGAPFSTWDEAIARDEQVSFHFKTPASFGTQQAGYIALCEHNNSFGGAVPCPREGALSTSPTDFSNGINGMGVFDGGLSPTIAFELKPPSGKKPPVMIQLLPNQDYYLNVQNVIDEQQSGVAQFGTLVTLSAH